MELNPRHVMVVLSGGQDSTTCLGWALQNFEHVSAVSIDYGQKHSIELDAAATVVAKFNEKINLECWPNRLISHQIIKLGDIFAGTSPLTNKDEELETYSNHDEMDAIIGDRIEKTFVPMRNAVFLMLAANRAAASGAGALVTGVCQADNANYPDCRQDFIDAAAYTVNQALGFGDDMVFYIHTPLMYLSKADSIRMAKQLNNGTYEMLAWTHTAYDGKYPPVGKDHASTLRAHGFEEAELPDPLVIRAWRENKMPLPKTNNYAPSAILASGL